MGAGASQLERDFPVPTDLVTCQAQVNKLRSSIEEAKEESEVVERYFAGLVDKRVPPDSEDALDDWQAARTELLDEVKTYMQICTPSPPESLEELVTRSGEEVNASSVERDDDGKAGHLFAFNLPSLTSLPDEILSVSSTLVTLCLKKNQLTDLPSQISGFENLKHLDISENNITELPESITECTMLEHLNASENLLNILPPELGDLVNLKELILFKNQLSKMPDSIGRCVALEEVNFFNNKLIKVPKTMADLENLRDLNLGGNKLKTIPSTLKWINLERLALSWNTIVMLAKFGGMPKLRQLQLSRNQLETLDDDCFAECVALEEFDISSNRIAVLPTSVTALAQAKTFNVSSNQLTALPDLSNLKNVEIMNIGTNKITSLESAHIDEMQVLRTLLANDNALVDLPESLGALPKLTRLNVAKNADMVISDELRDSLKQLCEVNEGTFIQ